MTHDWFPVLTGLIGTAVGAGLGLTTDFVNSKRSLSAAKEAWRRDRAVQAIESAYDAINVVYTPDHVNYEAWRLALNRSNLAIRLYCNESVRGAFASVKGGLELWSSNPSAEEDPRAKQVIGESVKYFGVVARHELGVEGSDHDVHTARAVYLGVLESMKSEAKAEPNS